MADPFARTNYRVAQHWRFRTNTPEARDTLIVTAVEDHPVQGIVCCVEIEFDPPFQSSPNAFVGGCSYWFTQSALDASVTELEAEKGPFPRHLGSRGEFQRDAESWGPNPLAFADDRTVGEVLAEAYSRLVERREQEANQPPSSATPDESLGLWSLIAYDKADYLRDLLQQRPTFVNVPLPQDESDEYCYFGEEYDECYPLMLAAELSSVEVTKLLLEFGADVHQRNSRGETALHFSGKASSGGCGANEVARTLCERGADPNAENNEGKPPLIANYCMTEVAEVLVEFGAKLELNYALSLQKLDWVRQQLQENPSVVEQAARPQHVIDDVVHMLASIAAARTGSWDYDDLSGWYRAAEVEKNVFEEHRDILEGVAARGADLKSGSALFYAVQNFDISLAAWLLEHGVDPNRDLKRQATYMPDIARSQRMINLLKRHGAIENPYPREFDEWERHTQSLKAKFI